jgi:hypothetical protein
MIMAERTPSVDVIVGRGDSGEVPPSRWARNDRNVLGRGTSRGVVGCVVLDLLVMGVLGSCGTGDDAAMSAPSTSSTVGSGRVTDGPIEAVVADRPAFSPYEPHGWLLVELRGTDIDGDTEVILQVPYDEVGCGAEGRRVDFLHLEPGTTLTFERGQAETQSPLGPGGAERSTWPSTPPISAVRVRTVCPAGSEEAAATLAAHRALWEVAGIHTYDFTLRYASDFLNGTYQISVVEAEPISAKRLEAGAIKDYMDVPELPKTIDEVFDQLERELGGDRFVGEFNETLGYPTHVFVDRTENAVDDEWEFFITDLVIGSDPTVLDTSPTAPTT